MVLWLAIAGIVYAQSAPPDPGKKKKDQEEDELVVLSPFCISNSLGVTPGGMKSVAYSRELLELGMLPLPGEFAAEGLFSEYDLPLPAVDPGTKLLRITGAGKSAAIVGQPEVTHLVQIGFASSLTPENFKRDPLFLVLVLDVSGSMEPKLALLKKSAQTALARLHAGDAIAVVTFSEDARTEVAPVLYSPAAWAQVSAAIDAIAIRGSTSIEAGLRQGFGLAEAAPAGFAGRRRVMLITDEMPNVGATTPAAFMAQATDASLHGVGLTTIGVGIDFNADFVRRVSSVSGGNAYWFGEAEQMQSTLEKEFDLMVTEVAYDLKLQITPAKGFRVEKVYGVPGETYAKTAEGGIVIDVPTLFLSHNKGAIFLTLVADRKHAGQATLGRADLSYLLYGDKDPVTEAFEIRTVGRGDVPPGLSRGELLVSECEAIAAASTAFYDNNHLGQAAKLAEALRQQFDRTPDHALDPEAKLVKKVAEFLTAAEREPVLPAGSDGEMIELDETSLIGVWQATDEDETARLALLPGGHAVRIAAANKSYTVTQTEWSRSGLGQKANPDAMFRVDRSGLYLASAGPKGEKIRLKRVVGKR